MIHNKDKTVTPLAELYFVKKGKCQSAAVSAGKGSGDYESIEAFLNDLLVSVAEVRDERYKAKSCCKSFCGILGR